MIDNRVFGRETQLRIGKRAVIRNVWWTGRVFTKKYEGKFKGEGLQAMADIGNWQTGIADIRSCV